MSSEPGRRMRGAQDVGRHQVGRGLHALEAEAQQLAERFDDQRLGDAGHALEQRVALAEDGDQNLFDDRGLAGDDAAQLLRAWAISWLVARRAVAASRLKVCRSGVWPGVDFLVHEALSCGLDSILRRLPGYARLPARSGGGLQSF